MRKVTTPATVCKDCGSILKHEECEYFCDLCKLKIVREYPLRISVFWEDYEPGGSDTIEFCSWKCLFKWLDAFPLNKKLVHFINIDDLGGSEFNFIEEYNAFMDALRGLQGKCE